MRRIHQPGLTILSLIIFNGVITSGIYVPSTTGQTKNAFTKSALGSSSKTLQWQTPEIPATTEHVFVYQNYTNVKLQQHLNDDNLKQIYVNNNNRKSFEPIASQNVKDVEDVEQYDLEPTHMASTVRNYNLQSVNPSRKPHHTSQNHPRVEYSRGMVHRYQDKVEPTTEGLITSFAGREQENLFASSNSYPSYANQGQSFSQNQNKPLVTCTTNCRTDDGQSQGYQPGNNPGSQGTGYSGSQSNFGGYGGVTIHGTPYRPYVNTYSPYYNPQPPQGHRQSQNFNTNQFQPVVNQHKTYKAPQNYYSGKIQSAPRQARQPMSNCPQGHTGPLPSVNSCNQFLNCWNGRGVVQNCAPGTLFNPQTLECDFPDKVDCVSGPRTARYEKLTVKEKASCPNGFSGIVPHYQDCSKFLNCDNGRQVEMNCPPGTLFDSQTNVCDHAYKVQCVNEDQKQKGFERYMVKPEGQQVDQIRNHGIENGEDRQNRFNGGAGGSGNALKCPPGFSGLMPHPTDCSKFLNCGSGMTFIQNCGPGTHFSPSLKVCDHIYNVKCGTSGEGSGPNQWQGSYGGQQVSSGTSINHQWTPNNQESNSGRNWNQTSGQHEGNYNPGQNMGGQHHQQPQYQNHGGLNQWTNPNQSNPGANWNYNNGQHQGNYHPGQNMAGQGQGQQQPASNQWSNNQQSNPGHNWNQNSGQQQQPSGSYNPGNNYQNPGQNMAGQGHSQPQQPQYYNPSGSNQWSSHNQSNPGQNNYQNQGQNPQNSYGSTNIQCNPNCYLGQGHNQHQQPQYQNPSNSNQWSSNNQQSNPNQNWNQNPGQQQQAPPGSYYPGNNYQNQGQNPGHNMAGQGHSQSQQPQYHNPSGLNQWSNHNQSTPGQNNYQNQGQNPQNSYGSTNIPCNPNCYQNPNLVTNPGTTNYQPSTPVFPNSANWGPNGHYTNVGQNQGRDQSQSDDLEQKIQDLWQLGPNPETTTPSYETLTVSSSQNKRKPWPPPFPTNKQDDDYVLEYDDLVEIDPKPIIPLASTTKPNLNSGSGLSSKVQCTNQTFDCGYGHCISHSFVCNGQKDCPNNEDEQDCSLRLQDFIKTAGAKLAVRETIKMSNVTLAWCASKCAKVNCKGFNFRKHDGTCYILDTNVGTSGALIILPMYDYFENRKYSTTCDQVKSFLCANQKCIPKSKLCDGVNDCGDAMDEKGCTADAFDYELRLAGGDNAHSGRLELQVFGRKGYICDDMFGLKNADVACRELGFNLGAAEVRGNSHFAQDIPDNETLYLMDDVTCTGNETTLRDCDFNGWGKSNCKPQEIVGVICKTQSEICPKDHWTCKNKMECLHLAFVCDGVYDCTDRSDEHSENCDAPLQIRLTQGTQGRLEVRHNGIWGTVCDDDFNDDAAKVVCHELGYTGSAKVVKDGHFGPGTGPIWLDQVFCRGNESALDECVHWDWGEHNCEHSEDVGVICNVNGPLPGTQRNQQQVAVRNDWKLPDKCGLRSDAIFNNQEDPLGAHFRVIMGGKATQGEYPWQASIRVKGKTKSAHWCGAIVVSSRYLLTAAHCLIGYSKGAYFIVAGDYNVDTDEGTEQEGYIEDFIIHPQFGRGNKMNNDIAVVRLKGKGFNITKDVQPVCLPPADIDYPVGLNCTISGFGSIESGKSKASHDLRAGWIPILSKQVCQMPHVYGAAITDGMLCAGFMENGVDACDGDSGGPLACLHEGVFKLFGITSWGQHCGLANKPGVYVNVAKYRNWIEETIKELSKL